MWIRRKSRIQKTIPSCLNCNAPFYDARDNYCTNCGQARTDGRITFPHLVKDAFRDILNIDSRIFLSLRDLIKPGVLTQNFFEGRHQTYYPPARFFFVTMVLHFALFGYILNTSLTMDIPDLTQEEEIKEAQHTKLLLDTVLLNLQGTNVDKNYLSQLDSLRNRYDQLSHDSIELSILDFEINGQTNSSNILLAKSLLKKLHLMPQKSGILFSNELASNIYTHTFEPKPRLMIFGAGEDVIPLVDLANKTGFSVIVSDWRPALCNKEVFPKADQLIVGFPEESLEKIGFHPTDSAIVVSHNFQRDKEYLQYLLTKEIRYLGVLGSKNRTQRLLEGNIIPPHVKSPIGLSIGAEGPEEIAVSIVAELIQQRKKIKEGITHEKWNHRHISCCG